MGAIVATIQRDRLIERTKAGLARARSQGRVDGRPRKHPPLVEAAVKMLDQGRQLRRGEQALRHAGIHAAAIQGSAQDINRGGRHCLDALVAPTKPSRDSDVMFCPRCGSKMVEVSGELCCERTGMALSQHMRQSLTEVFIDRTRAGRRGPDSAYTLGGPFFCPGCGEGMKVEGCHATCRRCGGVLDEFVYPLIEVHPHP